MEYGLIGEKLGHSFSKVIHESIMDYTYELHPLPLEEFDAFMKKKDFKAINVTIPYKEKVIPYLDEIDENAKRIGAINVVVNKNGKLVGHNSDYDGLKLLIEKNGLDLKDKTVMILGSGGTSKTASALCADLKAKEIIKVSRNAKEGFVTYKEAESLNPNIIINTTPCGMYPDIFDAPISLDSFKKLEGVIDAIFNPLSTTLVLNAKEKGIMAEGGLYMLVGQAVKAIEYFKDIKLDDDILDKTYRKILKEKLSIALIGMPGCGKSTIARSIDKDCIDTDDLIFEKTKRKPDEIIKSDGEDEFRKIESAVIKELSSLSGKVIALGGGAVLRKENIFNLKHNCQIIYIKRDLDKLQMSANRPLSSSKELLEKRYAERKELYETYADKIIENNTTIEDVLKEI